VGVTLRWVFRTCSMAACRCLFEEWPFQVAFVADGYVANHLARAGEDLVRVGKQRAAMEAQGYVAVGGDVAKAVLQRLAGE